MYPYQLFLGMNLYDVCLIVAMITALFLADRMGVLRGFSIGLQKTLILCFVFAIAFGFGGAILFQSFYNYLKNGVFEISGMTFYGGLIFGVIAFICGWFFYGYKKCKNDEPIQKFGAMADIAACLVPLAHGIGRIGCFTAGCCHGAVTDAWYGVKMLTENGWQKVVPVQLFEALFLFALSGVLLWLFFGKFGKENKGRFPLLPVYAFTYGIWRFFIEFARGDDRGATIVPFLSPSQLIALLTAALGVGYFLFWYFKKKKAPMDGAK